MTDLEALAKLCLYNEPNEIIRDQIFRGIRNQAVSERLLAEGDLLTLENNVTRCRAHEMTEAQLKSSSGSQYVPIK